MRNFIQKFTTFILFLSILFIFLLTTFFCLDVFEIIDVPEGYSLVNMIYSKVQVISSAQPIFEEIIPSDNETKREVIIKQNDDTTIVELDVPQIESAYSINTEPNDDKVFYSNETNTFYYNQLDEYGKIIYAELYNHKEELKSGIYTAEFGTTFNDLLHQDNGSDVLNNAFQLSVNALAFDNPELFYIDITKMYLLTEITTKAFSKTYKVSIGPNEGNYLSNEFYTEEIANNAIEKINNVKDNIIRNATGDTYYKVKFIHDYLIDNIEYETTISEPNIYNIYGALINGRAVCEGYARSFKYILDDLGIPCIVACGIAVNSSGESENHAWNYVQIDGSWYAVDSTWDDPIIVGYGRIDDSIRYEYFLKGSDDFFKDHFEDGNIISNSRFKYPAISSSNYR